jgi:hypothetical protein
MRKQRPSAKSPGAEAEAQARLDQQNALQTLAQWNGQITPEAAKQGQAAKDAQERANRSPVPVVFPVQE